ncbi:MAG: M56 family metallopeptidase [Aquaticitalea sp.]
MTMLVYLIKFSACLAIFMVFYKLFLERENMHLIKRYYLLAVLILSLGIPFVTFVQYIEPTITDTFVLPMDTIVSYPEIENVPAPTNYTPIILWSLYGLGFLIFGLKFSLNLSHIYKKIKHNPKHRNQRFINVLLTDLITPHTFFSYIFLNKRKYEAQEIPQEVFIHEQTHARQKHSIDVLCIELLQVVFWFNPLLYLIKKDIKLNHEFLADQAVLKNGIQPSAYQTLLLAFSSDAQHVELANAINYSSIKKRFTVMKTHTSKQKIWLRSLLLLPLVALTLYGFSERKDVVREDVNSVHTISDTIQNINIYIDKNENILLNKKAIKFENLQVAINKLNDHLTTEEKQLFLSATIKYETEDTRDLMNKIPTILFNCNIYMWTAINVLELKTPGVNSVILKNKYAGKTIEEANKFYEKETIDLSPYEPADSTSPWQISTEVSAITYTEIDESKIPDASKELVEEYNTIARKFNSKASDDKIYKLKDVNRIYIIYPQLSKKQKEAAEKYPDIFKAFSTDQLKATPEEVEEYNKLAKHCNSELSDEQPILKVKDIKRLEYLYSKMSDDQKKNAETYPDFSKMPPPPSPETGFIIVNGETLWYVKFNPIKYYNKKGYLVDKNGKTLKGNNQVNASDVLPGQYINKIYQNDKVVVEFKDNMSGAIPPPPPPPPLPPPSSPHTEDSAPHLDNSPLSAILGNQEIYESMKKFFVYQEAEKQVPFFLDGNKISSKQAIEFVKKTNNFKIEQKGNEAVYLIKTEGPTNINGTPPPPPAPISPLDHMIEMAKKGAIFYYEGKSISSDEAIKLLKNNSQLNISTKQVNSKEPKVYISKEPIIIKD